MCGGQAQTVCIILVTEVLLTTILCHLLFESFDISKLTYLSLSFSFLLTNQIRKNYRIKLSLDCTILSQYIKAECKAERQNRIVNLLHRIEVLYKSHESTLDALLTALQPTFLKATLSSILDIYLNTFL